jgi:hypothetical protein
MAIRKFFESRMSISSKILLVSFILLFKKISNGKEIWKLSLQWLIG